MSGSTEPSQLLVSVKKEVQDEEFDDFLQKYLSEIQKEEENCKTESERSTTLACKEEMACKYEIKKENESDLREYDDSPTTARTPIVPDETTNWYPSDEEDGGGSVSSILKSLKKQNEMLKSQPQAPPKPPQRDPRLQKGPPSDPRDPRVKADPRQRNVDPRKSDSEPNQDPRLSRDPRKLKPAEPALSKPDAINPPGFLSGFTQ